jgi:hypothetical protein
MSTYWVFLPQVLLFFKPLSAHALHLINPTAEFKGLIVYSILCDMTSWDYRSYLNYNIA